MKLMPLVLLTLICSHAFFSSADQILFISGNTFKSIANHVMDERSTAPLNPGAIKPYDIIFLKTDLIPQFFEMVHPKISNKYILITHNADASPIFLKTNNDAWHGYSAARYLNDETLVVWFAQNVDYAHPKLKPLPIGIANSSWAHGNVQTFSQALQTIPPLDARSSKVYLNFTMQTNPHERKQALDFFKNKSFAFFAAPKALAEYLSEMKQFKYVISPPGNGFDCHRTWEALLMGCIPIVKHSLLDSMFQELPVIIVDQWSEINPSFLETKLKEITTHSYHLEKAYATYWINLIKSYQAN